MAFTNNKEAKRIRAKYRIRKRINGTPARPRLTVYRSNKEIYAQVIDDTIGKTLVSACSLNSDIKSVKTTKTDQAKEVGKRIALKAIESGIDAIVFDRNGYLYHGRIKTLAEAAREAGLKF